MQLPKVELKQANIPMWIFQNTFASTETQRHVKPLRMIDEVCFEMADKRGTQQWKKLEIIGLQAQKLDKLENV